MTGRCGATARREREGEYRYASDGQLLHGPPFQADPLSTAVDVLAQRVPPCIRPGISAPTRLGGKAFDLRHRLPYHRAGGALRHLRLQPGCEQYGTVTEADNAAEWARLMVDRYGVGDVEHLTAEGEAMTVEERAEFLLIFERLAFIEACGRPLPDPGTCRSRGTVEPVPDDRE